MLKYCGHLPVPINFSTSRSATSRSGLRADNKTTSEGTPFFANPYVALCGIPAQRHQDKRTSSWKPWCDGTSRAVGAVLAFVGAGKAYGKQTELSEADTEVAKGVWLHYLIARKLGLFAGAGSARGLEDGCSILEGSAWH